MSKLYSCIICDSKFKNSRSLYAHKYKYHPQASTSTADSDRELKNKYGIGDNESIIANEDYQNKLNSLTDDSSQNEININENKSLSPYTERLPKLFMIIGDVLKDIKYLKKVINVNQSRNISSINNVISMMKYIERLPKLFRITGNVVNDVKDLEMELKTKQDPDNSLYPQMEGSGKEYKNKISELSDDIDDIFLKFMELDKYLEKKAGGIEYMEKAFDNTLQMIHLFKNEMYNDIKYKIKELRNAAMVALKLLERTNCLGKDNEELLNNLANASIFEGKNLLKNNIESLHEIFSLLPDEEVIFQAIKEVKDSENGDYDKDTHLTVDSDKDIDMEIDNSENEDDRDDDTQSVGKEDSDKDTDTNVANSYNEEDDDDNDTHSADEGNLESHISGEEESVDMENADKDDDDTHSADEGDP